MRAAPLAAVAATCVVLGAAALAAGRIDAQTPSPSVTRSDARAALDQAEADRRAAGLRAQTLEKQAERAEEAAKKAASERAALAARIQQAEAAITAAEVRVALIQDQQAALDLGLAEKRQPLLRLTAALQRMARRPLALSALKPGSLKDAVYVRAMLATSVPEIQRRTSGLRAELARSRKLASEASAALATLRETESTLDQRRRSLAALEARERMASRQAGLAARREQERAFTLAEEARDLDALVGEFDRAGALRARLAALPGPVLRPSSGGPATVRMALPTPDAPTRSAPSGYRLPVTGRIATGFGERSGTSLPSTSVKLAPRAGAVVVAPAAGRVVFAGTYRGYGKIVIIEHGGGWTSVVTGLARTDARVGEQVVGGSPLGRAGQADPAIGLELRKDGRPTNPLSLIR